MNTQNHVTIWHNCLEFIKQRLDAKTFKTWFEPIRSVSLNDSTLTILVPAPIYYEWIEENHIDVLGDALRQELGVRFSLEYQVQLQQQTQPPLREKEPAPTPAVITNPDFIKNPYAIPGLKKNRVDSQLDARYTFDNFIEGDCNRIARSAGLAIAQKPGTNSFNPLILYGTVGVGKTHLAHAIGNTVLKHHEDKNVLYTTCPVFMDQLVLHIKNNNVADFVNFYNALDVLIIDDIQFLSGKLKMQEIFFNIFNVMHQSHRQVILTSDKPPKDLVGIEDRLISRFKWGLTADLHNPDLETRMAIMMNLLEKEHIAISADVLEFICFHINDYIRSIEGAVNIIKAQILFGGKTIVDMQLAKQIVTELTKQQVSKEITMESVMDLVAAHFKVTKPDMIGSSRKRQIVEVRQIAMFLVKKLTNRPLTAIGEAFGGRDHATVIYSCRTVENFITTDAAFAASVEEIEKKIHLNLG